MTTKKPLTWRYTQGLGLRDRLRIYLSALICQRDIGWTCAECKAKP